MRASPSRRALLPHCNTAPRTTRRVAARLVAARRVALIGIIVSCLSLGLVALAASGQSPSEIQLPDNPLRGRVLYESKQCVQCHGLAGSEASIGPILGEGRFDGTFLELGAALWNHVPGMTVTFDVSGMEWPQLSARQATELVAFLDVAQHGLNHLFEIIILRLISNGCQRILQGRADFQHQGKL